MASILELLKRLSDHGVEYVVVGGMAGVAHGSSLVTEDLDVCSPLTPQNLSRICAALADMHPCWRMNPGHPQAPLDPARLAGFKNLYYITDQGQIDFLSEVSGVGEYDAVLRNAIPADLGGVVCKVLDLEALIAAKKALGRPKDLQAVRELEAIRERLRKSGKG